MNRFGIGYTNSCIPNSNDINKTIADRHGMIPVLAVSVVSDILMVFMQPTGPVESAKQESGLAIPHTATATVASLVSGPSWIVSDLPAKLYKSDNPHLASKTAFLLAD